MNEGFEQFLATIIEQCLGEHDMQPPVVVRTVGDGLFHPDAPVWHAVVNAGQTASELFLVCGMTAVGLSVSFNDMWRIGWRPLAAGFLVATLVGLCSLALTSGMYHFFG